VRVAVTGAAGFIGSHTMQVLQATEVVGFDITGDISDDEIVHLDVRWPKDIILNVFREYELEAIIHLAGVLGTHELFDAAENAIKVNIRGQYSVAWAALQMDIPIVMIEQPHIWTNVYETTRGAGVRLARGLAEHRGLRMASVEAYNAFGERQAHGPGHPIKIVPNFAYKATHGELAPIYGSGKAEVNLIHAKDIAKVMVSAIDVASEAHPHFLGAAYGGNFTTNEVWQMIYDYALPYYTEAESAHMPMREGETDDGIGAPADYEKLEEQEQRLGWMPCFDLFDLERTINYYRELKI